MTTWEDLDPSRVAFVGDLHGNSHAAVRAIEYAADLWTATMHNTCECSRTEGSPWA